MDCESALNPKNLQNTYERSLGYTDETYTVAVDNGSYANFVYDCVGYGLCQWTWHTRKRGLLTLAKQRGASIGDLETQLEYLYQELTGSFSPVLSALKKASSVAEASNIVLIRFEAPYDSGASVQKTRASYSQKYYNRFAGGVTEVEKNMGYYTVAKNSRTKLSEHFNSNEFDCHGTGCCNTTLINEKLVSYLEKIREHFGMPITITSGYRCVVHNKNIGGTTGSRHSKGDAADIVVKGATPRTVAQYAESIGILGIGLYETSADGFFTHIDTRDKKSFWYGQSCVARTTFGGASSSSGSSGSSSGLLSYGSSGSSVKELQENLIALGYNCGSAGADGVFGDSTVRAVKEFQSDHNLTADGIVGNATNTAIQKALKAGQTSTGYKVRVTASALNIRSGAGTNYSISGTIRDKGLYTITAESNGNGATKWGRLSNGRGWISLDYCTKV